jgi:CRISPR system Cascade subunit CasE
MYLSRLILNPRSRQVRNEISDPYETHRTIQRAFDTHPAEPERVLFRMEVHPRSGIPSLLVQSRQAPDWTYLTLTENNYLLSKDELPLEVDNPAVKEFDLQLQAGQTLAFRLRANPSAKKDREGKEQGRRMGILDAEGQIAWLKRKLEAAGSQLLSVNITESVLMSGSIHRGTILHALQFLAVQYDGVLLVKNADMLLWTVGAGIGAAKGLGCGLLSLARAG